MVEVYGALLSGSRASQPGRTRPGATRASTSKARPSVTTSASSPSRTPRACLPEPPCDWRMDTRCPVRAAQSCAKAAFTSR